MGIIKKYFMPNEYVQSIFQIDIDKLAESGVKGIVTDLDNTVVGCDVADHAEAVTTWFKEARQKWNTITSVSNNNEKRVGSFSKSLKVDYIFKAKKPRGRAFDRAMHSMSLNPSEIVVIGDQMLTDVFGGNRRGLFTIMVVPVK